VGSEWKVGKEGVGNGIYKVVRGGGGGREIRKK